ncbi:MAG: hypothetical protein IJ087_12665 [Eggerthellaceae bacterium]|nr:hypothetical protein [Eggerthellaceae bacterium]
MDKLKLYDILYALTARDGREDALFGDCGQAARVAFSRSLAGETFPEIWFEVPLAGERWLDFHALVSHEDVAGTQAAFSGQSGVYADALDWFSSQREKAVRQLALSYDTHTGDVDNPAVQLLVGGTDASVPLGYLEAIGRADLKDAYRAFTGSMPEQWYACYIGSFPGRQAADTAPWVRIECIMGDVLQQAYAKSADTLREHLGRVGLDGIGEDAIKGICELARAPFPLELQFNVGTSGEAMPVISASVRFQPTDWINEQSQESIAELVGHVRDQGLDDGRSERLAEILFSTRVAHGDEAATVSCFPAFLKLRWCAGEPACAKAYLMAMVQ